jgi:hypothetical protein
MSGEEHTAGTGDDGGFQKTGTRQDRHLRRIVAQGIRGLTRCQWSRGPVK